jgi:hypothetical protein
MLTSKKLLLSLAASGVVLAAGRPGLREGEAPAEPPGLNGSAGASPSPKPRSPDLASGKDLLPPGLPKEQRQNLQRFLQDHEKPDRFIPPDGKLVDAQPASVPEPSTNAKGKPIKQYMVQIISHRPVPGQEQVKLVDVVYYRPNPEKGKPGITVRHTVDLTTGKQIGDTEVSLKRHTPISREELAEAVELARDKSPVLKELYKDRDKNTVHWEYLQLMINRKQEPHEPGDRVVRLVFTAPAVNDQPAPEPVRIIVNLTKGVVAAEER